MKEKAVKDQRISFRISEDLAEHLNSYLENKDTTVSEVMRDALIHFAMYQKFNHWFVLWDVTLSVSEERLDGKFLHHFSTWFFQQFESTWQAEAVLRSSQKMRKNIVSSALKEFKKGGVEASIEQQVSELFQVREKKPG